MKKRYLNIFFIAFTSILFYNCTGYRQKTNVNSKLQLPVVEVVSIDTVLYKEYVADIQAVKNVDIRARIGGYLDEIYVDEGQEVKKGQLLFRLNNTEQKAKVSNAEANLSNAISEAKTVELDLNRVKLLADKDVVSKSALDLALAKYNAAKASVDAARSELVNAKAQLSYTSILAPFNGVIDRLPLKAGSMIEEGALLTSVSDLSSVHAYFNVSENEYLQYLKAVQSKAMNRHDKVKLVLADGSGYSEEGRIETTESEFEENTGSIAFRARFPNPDKLLKHGATGKVHLPDLLKEAIIIPEKAVFEIQDKNYLFVVNDKNVVKMVPFIPKKRFSHFYIVESGVKAGDRIVYEGIQNVKEGMEIIPELQGLDSLLVAGRKL